MTEAWKTWEGQVVDGFLLRQYLGGSDHSAVYFTELKNSGPQNAAIKFIPADAAADAQMARWQVAGQLLHPNLLQLIRMGRCQMANADFLYVVMEYVEEDLSQILPQRALDAGETRQIVEAALQALGYLNGQGLAHTRIKPSNILATGDQLKISTDTLCEIGSAPLAMPRASVYAAPESASAPIAAAADVWSLGVTVVEALTQRTPVIRSQTRTELPLPETIPPPFLEIARRSVQLDPTRRANLAEISALLNPGKAGKRDPLLVPQSTDVVVPETVKKSLAAQHPSMLPRTLMPAPVVTGAMKAPEQAASPRKGRLALPLVVVILVIAALLLTPRVLNRYSQLQPQAATVQPSVTPASETLAPPSYAVKPGETKRDESAGRGESSAAAPKEPAAKKAAKPAAGDHARGAVVYQVVPDVSEQARQTILGTVRVRVKAHVDENGNVSGAELDGGSSGYFGNQALQVVNRWTFKPPQVDGQNTSSEWMLRFEFTPTATKVFPTQTNP
jgi:TonB family protein